MGTASDVARSAGIDLVVQGGSEYIRSVDVEQFLEALRERGIGVLGFEGFRLSKDATMPDMDAIADLSSLELGPHFVELSIDYALSFVREIGNPELYFEFVLERRTR